MKPIPILHVYPTSILNGWAFATWTIAPPIMRGGHGDERKIVQIYETDSIQPQTRRHLPNDKGELLQDEPRQLREGGVDGSNWSDGV